MISFTTAYAILCIAFAIGLIVGKWGAHRDILHQCRKLGGFYIGETTVKVSAIDGPSCSYGLGGQTPGRRPTKPPPLGASDKGSPE